VPFDRTQTRAEHHLPLGHLCYTDWFPGGLMLQVSTTPPTPQRPTSVTTDTERVTERVSLLGPPPEAWVVKGREEESSKVQPGSRWLRGRCL
jgi:hypothetical protein